MAIIAITETQRMRCGVGVYRDEGPPVPIPNTAVKLISADNTWLEAAREDKATPTQTRSRSSKAAVLFFKETEGFAMDNKGGRVVFMPDIEYRAWVNRNKDLLEQIVKDKQVSTVWLRRGQNKAFLIRYFEECGYTITID